MDQTEIKGAWDFDLKFTPRGMTGPDGPLAGTITLFDALEKLGLKLDPVDVPLPVIVVDSVNQKPTANAPKVGGLLHPAEVLIEQAWDLTDEMLKPKIKKALPANRTKYKEGPASDGKDPRNKNPILGRLVTCQNMTIAQFAEKLRNIAPG